MPKRKAKEVVVKLTEEEENNKGILEREEKEEEEEEEEGRNIFEAEREIDAIRDVKIKQSLTALRLTCSTFAEEQLETPVLCWTSSKRTFRIYLSNSKRMGEEFEFKWNHNNNGDSSLPAFQFTERE